LAKTIPLWKGLELTSGMAYCVTGQCLRWVVADDGRSGSWQCYRLTAATTSLITKVPRASAALVATVAALAAVSAGENRRAGLEDPGGSCSPLPGEMRARTVPAQGGPSAGCVPAAVLRRAEEMGMRA
jgi:hypothetical protein